MTLNKFFSSNYLIYSVAFIPAYYLLYQFYFGLAWIDPIEEGLHGFGIWTLRFLLMSLAVRPVVRLADKPHWFKYRRIFGLVSVFYLCCHMLIYVVYDQDLMWRTLVEELTTRVYLLIGLVAATGLLSMALTSNQFSIAKLGHHWQRLHQWIYLWVSLAVLHFYLSVKADILEPLLYAGIVFVLLGMRIWWRINWYHQKNAL